jgi:hypothetical protein
MPRVIDVPTFTDARGSLSVLDGALPFPVRRVYYIHGNASGARRAGHRHRRNRQVLVCLAGRCDVDSNDGSGSVTHRLDSPRRGLVLETADWHEIRDMSADSILLVLASEPYDVGDYIDEPYP